MPDDIIIQLEPGQTYFDIGRYDEFGTWDSDRDTHELTVRDFNGNPQLLARYQPVFLKQNALGIVSQEEWDYYDHYAGRFTAPNLTVMDVNNLIVVDSTGVEIARLGANQIEELLRQSYAAYSRNLEAFEKTYPIDGVAALFQDAVNDYVTDAAGLDPWAGVDLNPAQPTGIVMDLEPGHRVIDFPGQYQRSNVSTNYTIWHDGEPLIRYHLSERDDSVIYDSYSDDDGTHARYRNYDGIEIERDSIQPLTIRTADGRMLTLSAAFLADLLERSVNEIATNNDRFEGEVSLVQGANRLFEYRLSQIVQENLPILEDIEIEAHQPEVTVSLSVNDGWYNVGLEREWDMIWNGEHVYSVSHDGETSLIDYTIDYRDEDSVSIVSIDAKTMAFYIEGIDEPLIYPDFRAENVVLWAKQQYEVFKDRYEDISLEEAIASEINYDINRFIAEQRREHAIDYSTVPSDALTYVVEPGQHWVPVKEDQKFSILRNDAGLRGIRHELYIGSMDQENAEPFVKLDFDNDTHTVIPFDCHDIRYTTPDGTVLLEKSADEIRDLVYRVYNETSRVRDNFEDGADISNVVSALVEQELNQELQHNMQALGMLNDQAADVHPSQLAADQAWVPFNYKRVGWFGQSDEFYIRYQDPETGEYHNVAKIQQDSNDEITVLETYPFALQQGDTLVNMTAQEIEDLVYQLGNDFVTQVDLHEQSGNGKREVMAAWFAEQVNQHFTARASAEEDLTADYARVTLPNYGDGRIEIDTGDSNRDYDFDIEVLNSDGHLVKLGRVRNLGGDEWGNESFDVEVEGDVAFYDVDGRYTFGLTAQQLTDLVYASYATTVTFAEKFEGLNYFNQALRIELGERLSLISSGEATFEEMVSREKPFAAEYPMDIYGQAEEVELDQFVPIGAGVGATNAPGR